MKKIITHFVLSFLNKFHVHNCLFCWSNFICVAVHTSNTLSVRSLSYSYFFLTHDWCVLCVLFYSLRNSAVILPLVSLYRIFRKALILVEAGALSPPPLPNARASVELGLEQVTWVNCEAELICFSFDRGQNLSRLNDLRDHQQLTLRTKSFTEHYKTLTYRLLPNNVLFFIWKSGFHLASENKVR